MGKTYIKPEIEITEVEMLMPIAESLVIDEDERIDATSKERLVEEESLTNTGWDGGLW